MKLKKKAPPFVKKAIVNPAAANKPAKGEKDMEQYAKMRTKKK